MLVLCLEKVPLESAALSAWGSMGARSYLRETENLNPRSLQNWEINSPCSYLGAASSGLFAEVFLG